MEVQPTRMGPTGKAKPWIWAGGILLVLVLYDIGLGWWGSTPPKRPTNVSPDAVFIFGPAVGWIWPLPKSGDWLNCWLDPQDNVDRCRMAGLDGSLEYEGPYMRYEGSSPVPDSDLQIDVTATGTRLQWLYFHEQILPIIHLRDGSILIPADAQQEAKQYLERLRQLQNP